MRVFCFFCALVFLFLVALKGTRETTTILGSPPYCEVRPKVQLVEFFFGEGFPTKIDYQKNVGYQLILTSLLEDLGVLCGLRPGGGVICGELLWRSGTWGCLSRGCCSSPGCCLVSLASPLFASVKLLCCILVLFTGK